MKKVKSIVLKAKDGKMFPSKDFKEQELYINPNQIVELYDCEEYYVITLVTNKQYNILPLRELLNDNH